MGDLVAWVVVNDREMLVARLLAFSAASLICAVGAYLAGLDSGW